ncbi:MAG TPA: AarF/UbiB family protein [Acidimicrobiales bacterium]|nr:AarF/UbiB family protein [Acidimicrobiales bacterium]
MTTVAQPPRSPGLVVGASGLYFGWVPTIIIVFVAILGVAWLSGRLLGIRRSLGATLLSGVLGWLAGLGLSLVIADSQRNHSAGFTRNLWVFSLIFTMSAAVWMELLAKPGTLARAQSGLGSVPRPLAAIRRKARRSRRYFEITRIALRNGLGPWMGAGDHPDAVGAAPGYPSAHRLRHALEECGGMFVKLGQVMSTRSDLLPAEVVAELSHLQDDVAPADPDEVRVVLEDELGAPVEEVFASFDWEPVATASIAQAYRAELPDGDKVIVKVQRPGVAELVERDVDVLASLAETLEERTSWGAEYHVAEVASEFASGLREEIDFRVEARNAIDIRSKLATDHVRIPRVYDAVTTPKVLVMEWLQGRSVRHDGNGDGAAPDRRRLADDLLRCAMQQMLIDGHFHADPHPGNVMVLTDGTIGLIDFGATGRLDPAAQEAIRDMMIAVSRCDAAMLLEAIFSVATVRRDVDEQALERALARFMGRHLGRGTAPSAAMFNELLQLFSGFGINLPAEFSTFFRALVTLEGTLTTLSPGYLAIDAAQRVATEWARQRMEPDSLQELARQEIISLLPMLRRLPRHVDRIANSVERGTLKARLSLFSDAHDLQAMTRFVNRGILALLGGIVGVLSVMLLTSTNGPRLTGDTSLFQFFGYFGLFCATVLILRVLVGVVRDGLS